MRGLLAGLLLLLMVGVAGAQQVGGGSPVVTLDLERLFAETQYGQAVSARAEAENAELEAEFRKIEAALEAEERALTTRRAALPAAEFRKLADEFDARVEEVRRAQDVKSRSLLQRQDGDRKAFFDTALPILGTLMGEMGAVAILNRDAIIVLSFRIDITDAAIARLDAELGDGTKPPVGPLAPTPTP
ncbi:MAG: OmpH family outer membrane protein [Paracoccaceae bacterium]